MMRYIVVLTTLVLVFSCLGPIPCMAAASTDSLAKGYQYFNNGNFEDAAKSFQRAAEVFEKAGNGAKYRKALLELSRSYQYLGEYNKAILVLDLAEKNAADAGDAGMLSKILSGKGNALIFTGRYDQAEAALKKAMGTGIKAGDLDSVGAALNNLGNLYIYSGKNLQAIDSYKSGLEYAQKSGNRVMSAKMYANIGRTAMHLGKTDLALKVLQAADREFRGLPDSHEKVYGLINVAQTYKKVTSLIEDTTQIADLLYMSYKLLNDSASLSEKIADLRGASYAYGYLAQLHEERGSFEDAISLTRKAVYFGQKAQAPEAVYMWESQAGRLLKNEGKHEEAIMAFKSAVDTLQAVRQAMSGGDRTGRISYREAVEPVYYGLADLYLLKSADYRGEEEKAHLLKARETIESMKTAEMQDYFHDDCAVALKAKKKNLDSIVSDAAIIYIIPLRDRLELLVSTSSHIKRFTVPVTSEKLMENARLFREQVVDATEYSFLRYSYRLYNWLIKPIEEELVGQKISTLIFVPDGSLRAVPMAALRDKKSKQYLIEKFAVAVTPGLSLTDPKPIVRQEIKVMMAGLTEGVQGFAPLVNVDTELKEINSSYDCNVLKNKEFLVESFGRLLKETPYSIVHIASHGEFLEDARMSYLLAWDNKLTMDHLERYMGQTVFRDKPVELLTLSACKTAAGNDKASLGLAGVAIKAGARSALASLWYVDDMASSKMVVDFYKQLKNTKLSKAKALQNAQISILKDERYQHPLYWSAFILIGNWL